MISSSIHSYNVSIILLSPKWTEIIPLVSSVPSVNQYLVCGRMCFVQTRNDLSPRTDFFNWFVRNTNSVWRGLTGYMCVALWPNGITIHLLTRMEMKVKWPLSGYGRPESNEEKRFEEGRGDGGRPLVCTGSMFNIGYVLPCERMSWVPLRWTSTRPELCQ